MTFLRNYKQFLNSVRNIIIFRIRYPWIKRGKDTHCQFSTKFWSPHRDIVFGDYVSFGYDCLIQCDTRIGNHVLVASSVAFINRDDHAYNIVGKVIRESGRGDKYKVFLEDDIWVGHGVILVAPVRVGTGSIIAAGSVVVHDVPEYSIVGGVPAKVLKMRFSEEQVTEHKRLLKERAGRRA